jgi:AmiR/NasT family two-component response regulator
MKVEHRSTWQGDEQGSLPSLALLTMHESGADGYALFDLDEKGERLVQRHASGIPLPAPESLNVTGGLVRQGKFSVASYPLHLEGAVNGVISFAFRDAAISERRISIVDRMAKVIETVHAFPHRTSLLAARITSLEAELTDAKIAERVRGLLENPVNPDVVDTVIRHVEKVNRGRQFTTLLEQFLPALEDRVVERKLIVQAKGLLQRRHGMSEEQAYVHLRETSRTSRKRLRDVAQDLIER